MGGTSSFVKRIRLPLFAAALFAAALTLFGPAPQEALANPDCEAFANIPELVAGSVESNGGATCTSAGTGLFRVDVTLYRDGSEVGWVADTCHGEQQCGVLVQVADADGDQQWCAKTVAVISGSGAEGSGGSYRTEMICDQQPF